MATSDLNHALGEPENRDNRNGDGCDRLETQPDHTTNLLLADIVFRHASNLFQQGIERRVKRGPSANDIDPQVSRNGAALIRSLALLGASRIAARSPVGLGVVAGGLALKLLYDRGRARRARIGQAGTQSPPESQARRPAP